MLPASATIVLLLNICGRKFKKFFHAHLIINTDNRIIGGHMRRRIMLQSGYKPDDLVDVRVPERELTEREAEELAIRLNKNTGDWDRLQAGEQIAHSAHNIQSMARRFA